MRDPFFGPLSILASLFALALVIPACSDDEAAPSSDGGATPPPGGDGGSSGGDGPPGGGDTCPLQADQVVDVTLTASDFTSKTIPVGSDVGWELTASPSSATIPAIRPGETLAVSLRLEGAPISMARSTSTFYVTIVASTEGTTRAQATLETSTASAGELNPGPWQSTLSIDAGGRPTRIALGGITINPNEGESLSCFSVRTTVPAKANSVEDSNLVDIVGGAPLPITTIILSANGQPPEEPFAISQ